MPATRALRAALAEPWAITAEGLELVLSVAARENDVSIDALEAYRAEHVPTAERLTRRGSVAILDVRGPLVSRANLFTAISGATSYDILRRDLQAALDNPSIRAIVMSYDTPGGSVTNVDELAKAVRAGKAIKPIVAYVGGSAASAGYWLASQSTEIVIADTALLGSIGVRAALQDTSKKTPRPDGSNSFRRNPREANGPLNRRRASAHSAHD
ncbi:S49 family peptidase [Brucella sp. JSBI001]|uniref:S49 family peptidase n=1 Tax=Brucella sp. JSBI001 TaxID=2886044 RepID=UPI00222F5EB8|nr:S49 family peptidase [Brucella sp. JSBI001]UZD69127.1 S49 family peptidase [Brucella sp. JSBI001]